MADRHTLLNAPIGRVLFSMSLPNLFGIMTILGFGLADTFFISQLGTEALAAISFTFPVTLVISSIAIGIGAGVASHLGRLIGAKEKPKAKAFLHDALLLTFVLVSGIALLGLAVIAPLFTFLGANDTSLPFITQYMHYWYLGAPLLVLLMVGNQGLRATGDMRSPAIIMALAALINLILDPLLIFGVGPFPELGIKGAAIATIIAWFVALLLSFYLLAFTNNMLSFVGFDSLRVSENWRKLAHVAQPAALMNLLNPLANATIMTMLAYMDHSAVAAFGVGTRLESALLIVVMALSSSLVPFLAQNLGAGQPHRAKQALLLSLKFIFVFQTIIAIPLVLLAEPIAQLFSTDPVVIEWLSFYILVLPCAYGPLGMVIIMATALNAYHRPLSSLIINACRLVLLMLPLTVLGAYIGGVKGLLLALPITNILMGLACYWLAMKVSEPTAVSTSAVVCKGSVFSNEL